MNTLRENQSPLQVLIAGGGVAALETALALRAHAGARVDITILSPEPEFVYTPLSVGEPFGAAEAARLRLERLAEDLGCELLIGAVETVAADAGVVATADGATLPYDVLVLALGARRVPAYENALTFGGVADAKAMKRLLQELDDGAVHRVAFVVPGGQAWTLPLYELALMTARRAHDRAVDVEILLATPEPGPLAVFGREASDDVAALLSEYQVRVETSAYASVPRAGELVLDPGGRRIECDRVVALPALEGPWLEGVPRDADGFIPVDRHCRVPGLDGVYAAGDATTFAIKQGGLACQQADAAAEVIAREAGAEITPEPFKPVLRGALLTGGEPHYLREDVRGGHGEDSTASKQVLWWPPSKIAGRYLAPYLAGSGAGAWAGPPMLLESLHERPPEIPGVKRRAILRPLPGEQHFELLGWRSSAS